MNELSCCLLGTASGIPTKKRNNVSIALNIDGGVYILDAGEQCAASLLRNDIRYSDIKAIFISHMDVDHFAGVPMLLKSMLLWEARRKPLKLFVPEKAIRDVRRTLQMMYLMDEVLGFPFEILPIDERTVYDDGCASISFRSNRHIKQRFLRNPAVLERHPGIQMESFSLSIRAKGRRIVYTGDLASTDEMDGLVDGADILFSELAHFPPETFFKHVSKKNVKKVICLHLHPSLDDKEVQMLELAAENGMKDVQIGYDGLKIDFMKKLG